MSLFFSSSLYSHSNPRPSIIHRAEIGPERLDMLAGSQGRSTFGIPMIPSRREGVFIFRGHILQTLTSGGLHLAVLLEADGRNVDKAGGLGGGEVTDLVHGGLAHVVQLLSLGGTAENGNGTLVCAAADLAVDGLLRSGDGGLEELALGGEVHAVVQELGVVVGDEGVAQSTDLTVHDKTLKVTGKGQ
jgi:hypothetical protein